MTASFIHNTDHSVLKSPFANNIGGITSQYESRGGKRTKRVKRTKKSKKTRKTRNSRKQRI